MDHRNICPAQIQYSFGERNEYPIFSVKIDPTHGRTTCSFQNIRCSNGLLWSSFLRIIYSLKRNMIDQYYLEQVSQPMTSVVHLDQMKAQKSPLFTLPSDPSNAANHANTATRSQPNEHPTYLPPHSARQANREVSSGSL